MNPIRKHCEKHGEYVVEMYTVGDSEYEKGCPLCEIESNKEYYKEMDRRETIKRKDKIERSLRYSCVPDRFKECTFENYIIENKGQEKALTTCENYVKEIDDMKKTGSSLFMCGSYGTGKTHLAIAILLELINTNKISGIYTTTMRMLRDIRSSYRDKESSEQGMINEYVSYPLLILDEVGVQLGTESEKLLIYEVINGRYENYRSTILLSNLSFQEMTQYLGARAIDRLKSKKGSMIVMDWESWRGK